MTADNGCLLAVDFDKKIDFCIEIDFRDRVDNSCCLSVVLVEQSERLCFSNLCFVFRNWGKSYFFGDFFDDRPFENFHYRVYYLKR